MGLVYRKANRGSQKLYPLSKMANTLTVYTFTLAVVDVVIIYPYERPFRKTSIAKGNVRNIKSEICFFAKFSCFWIVLLYRIYRKYSDTSTPYHLCSKIWASTIHYPMLCLKIAGWVANSVDPDETPRSAASHLGLYCLLRPVCPNIYGKYGILRLFS